LNVFPWKGINLEGEDPMFRTLADRQRPPPDGRRSTDAQDVALIGRIARGELAAFEAFYRGYHDRLGRFLGLMTSQPAVVEEALNDTMLVVWKRAKSFNGQSKVSTWVFAIAYRTALKALRGHDEPVPEPESERAAGDDADPERRHAEGEARAALARALAALSHEQRSVLVLTYFHDLPYAEIALIADCPVDTAKTRAFHGRRRLRALLAGEPEDWL
jgi:RNA polymerase sigma-70 factor (ECF subfamily)